MLSKELQKYQQHQLDRDMNPAVTCTCCTSENKNMQKKCLSLNMSVLNDQNILS